MWFGKNAIKIGARFLAHRVQIASQGIKQYPGDAEQICRQVVRDCWNGTYFQGSAGHFNQFWMRDFGMSIESLLNLGYKEEVTKTLEFALDKYKKHNHIATTIFSYDKPIDVFEFSSDSLPFLIRSLRLAKAKHLVDLYHPFLRSQIEVYYKNIFDEKAGLVRSDKHFSSAKDSSNRHSSMYANTMVAMLSNELGKLKQFENPFEPYDLKKTLEEKFWTGTYFLDDLSGELHVASDANIFPFWLDVFNEKKMLESAITSMREAKLDEPFPLKYSPERMKDTEKGMTYFLLPNYEGNTIWTQLGAIYIQLLTEVKEKLAQRQINNYKQLIEKNKNYLEIFNPNGTVFKTMFYHADEGMIWASIFLDTIQRRKS